MQSNSGEIWKEILELPNFYVSNLGRIYRSATTHVYYSSRGKLSKRPLKSWYYKNKVTRNKYLSFMYLGKRYNIHRIVATAFCPNPLNKREVNHIDGVKSNNRADNLEWVTRQENMTHATEANKCAWKLTEAQVREVKRLSSEIGLSQRQIARIFNVHQTSIWGILNNKYWKRVV